MVWDLVVQMESANANLAFAVSIVVSNAPVAVKHHVTGMELAKRTDLAFVLQLGEDQIAIFLVLALLGIKEQPFVMDMGNVLILRSASATRFGGDRNVT